MVSFGLIPPVESSPPDSKAKNVSSLYRINLLTLWATDIFLSFFIFGSDSQRILGLFREITEHRLILSKTREFSSTDNIEYIYYLMHEAH
jgi:hypothetical protein